MAVTHASTQSRNSAPKPTRRDSYHANASVRSRSTSGAMISLMVMTAANPALDRFPRKSRAGVFPQVGFSAGQLLFLPVVDRYGLGTSGEVIPQILYKLELLRRAQVKHRRRRSIHCDAPAISQTTEDDDNDNTMKRRADQLRSFFSCLAGKRKYSVVDLGSWRCVSSQVNGLRTQHSQLGTVGRFGHDR